MKKDQCHDDMMHDAEPYTKALRMYSDFREQNRDVCRQPNGLPLNVVIAYENFSAGVRALGIFHGLFEGTEARYLFDMNNAWKFDFLRVARLREAAIGETARADMVIVSVNRPVELPPEVKWWMESSLEQREGDPGALIFVYHAEGETGAGRSVAESYLARHAQRAGLDFFVKRPNAKPKTVMEKRDDPWHFAHSQPWGRRNLVTSSAGFELMR